jgi:hypothetical protein
MFEMLTKLHLDESCAIKFEMDIGKFKALFDQQSIKRIEILGVRLYSGNSLDPSPDTYHKRHNNTIIKSNGLMSAHVICVGSGSMISGQIKI